MDEPTTRPPTAALLEELRTRRRLSKQRLAELADVSATYVRNIEAGLDESGRVVMPSANVIQKLARGLARAEPDESRRAEEERQAYVALMAAAGYLPTEPAGPPGDPLPRQVADELGTYSSAMAPTSPATGDGRRQAALRPAEAPIDRSSGSIAISDRRLDRHLRGLLEEWEALASEDQALLLGIAEFLAERRRRREGTR
jgi:transcriptional regulator with XRE-family HTH domain